MQQIYVCIYSGYHSGNHLKIIHETQAMHVLLVPNGYMEIRNSLLLYVNKWLRSMEASRKIVLQFVLNMRIISLLKIKKNEIPITIL